MIDKPDAANYAMDTRGWILIKTIMEIVDRSAIIRNGLRSLEWPYVIALPGKIGKVITATILKILTCLNW